MHLAECGLRAPHGEQEELIQPGETEIGGRLPVNTDGGCLANGEPIGASGLRQVYECVLQLRGDAGERQVPNEPQTAFTHVYGAPGISACTVLSPVASRNAGRGGPCGQPPLRSSHVMIRDMRQRGGARPAEPASRTRHRRRWRCDARDVAVVPSRSGSA